MHCLTDGLLILYARDEHVNVFLSGIQYRQDVREPVCEECLLSLPHVMLYHFASAKLSLLNYSFTPPTIIPLMKYFCRNGYRHMIGAAVKIAVAARMVIGVI